ncbi:MAG: aldo/keto reductase [Bacteroidales bacterium]|nr:aldo/keto reductase [Bacteroidales bacterium]
MEYKRLGSTNLEISRIGFGCWAIGGHGYGSVDDQESVKAIQKALDMGVNFFDTADVYGFGHSEEILSKALGSQRDKVIIATKFGVNWDNNGKTYKDCSPKRIVKALDGSLRRLKIDCIPLYQIHWHDGKTPIEDVMETLLKCRDAGKILHVGFCNFSKDLILKASNINRVESYQCLYNLAKRQNENSIKYSSEELGINVLAYSVIGRGVFSAKYSKNSQFGENDTRIKDPDFHGVQYDKNILIAGTLSEIGKKYGKSPAQVAIRWVLENSNVTCAITGSKTPEQVSENVDAMGWSLDQSDMELIDSMFSKK